MGIVAGCGCVSTVGSPDHSAGGLGRRTRLPNSPIDARNFPTWSKAARIIFALPPSSAPAERVFSVLKRLFGETRARRRSPTWLRGRFCSTSTTPSGARRRRRASEPILCECVVWGF